MLYNVSSILNLLHLLVVHTIVVEMSTYSSDRNFKNVNEYPFCEDFFDIRQCRYIKHVLRAFVDLYEVKQSNEEQNGARDTQTFCIEQIKNILEEIEIIKYQLSTLSAVINKIVRNNRRRVHKRRRKSSQTSHRNPILVKSKYLQKSWNPFFTYYDSDTTFKTKFTSGNKYDTQKEVFSFARILY